MVDILLQIGAAKLVVSAVLAGLAWLVQRRVGHPAVVYPLWLMVLVVLLLPAVVAVPVLPSGGAAPPAMAGDPVVVTDAGAGLQSISASPGESGSGTTVPAPITARAKAGVAMAWLVVSAVLLGWTLVRALRFRRWLARSSRPAPAELRREVAEIGHRLGLVHLPEARTTSAHVSPMVYWAGGRVRLVVPSFLLGSLQRQELRAVLAHELAHVLRRDHLVRWIEWLACSAFWWNPVAWLARGELRAAEEASCDALGAAVLASTPRAYAKTLLRVLEVLSTPSMPSTPAFASGVASGRGAESIARRLRMLVAERAGHEAPRWIRVTGLVAAVSLLPLGLVYCSTAVRATATALEESPGSLPIARFEMVAVVDLNRTDPRAAELNELWQDEPEYSYWIFNSRDGDIGPLPLSDAAMQPAECRLEPRAPDATARDHALGACTVAMSNQLRRTGDSAGGSVCVVWGSRASDWSGLCDSDWARDRRRVRESGPGRASKQLVVTHIGTTQS